MKTLRRSLVAAVLLASLAGFHSATTSAAATATVAPPTHSVTGCCYIFVNGKWYCMPC
jgi:hypothetical protein